MIKTSNLFKFYNKGKADEIKAVNGVSLELTSGLVMIVGKSGCGKSTLLHTLGGLDKPDSGEITIGDTALTRYHSATWDKLRNAKIGYVFQNYNLIDDLTVYENLEVVLKLAGVDPSEYHDRIQYALSLVGMDKYQGRLPTTLSGGQQQRVGVARAIVKGAEILIADEPTGNLDDTNTIAVMEILKGLSKHCLVVVVTHEEDLASFYADRIIRVVDGRITEDFDNHSTGSLDHHAQDRIYLGDLERKDVGDGVRLFFPEGSAPQGQIDVVYQNGRVLLKVSGVPNVALLNEDSTIQFVEGKYVPRDKEQEDLPIDESKLPAGTGVSRNPFSFKGNLKSALAPFLALSGQRRRNPYRVLYVTTVLFVIFLALVAPSFVFNRAEDASYDDHILAVIAEDVPDDTTYTKLNGICIDFLYINWDGLAVAPTYTIGSHTFSVLPASVVGVSIPQGEIWLDQMLFDRWDDGDIFNGIAANIDEAKGLIIHVGGLDLVVGGGLNRRQPTLYVNDLDYEGMNLVTPEIEYDRKAVYPTLVYADNTKEATKVLQDKGYSVFSPAANTRARYYTQAFTRRIVFFLLGVLAILIQFLALRRIAKSTYIGQIRTYVQYRALGVPKRYLYTRIINQNSIICILTTLRGWLITSIIVGVLARLDIWNMVKLLLGSRLLYYPWWVALAAGVFLYLTSLICNLASPMALLRHTPADLMTKYDI